MRTPRRQSGTIIIEVIVAGLIALLSGAAVIALLSASYSASNINMGQNTANAGARLPIDTMADQLRNAQSVTVGSSNQVFSAASTKDFTIYYLDNTGNNTERYWVDTTTTPSSLKLTQVNNGTSTTSVVLSGVTSLVFTYYTPGAGNYNAALAGWSAVSTDANGNVSSANLPLIGAVQISATVNMNGYSRTITSMVRLRNSPF